MRGMKMEIAVALFFLFFCETTGWHEAHSTPGFHAIMVVNGSQLAGADRDRKFPSKK